MCPTLWDPMGYRVHGILQARILEWVAVLFSRVSSQSRDRTQVSCIVGGFFTSWASGEALTYVKNLADVQAPGQLLCISYCPHLYHLHFHHLNTFFFFFFEQWFPKYGPWISSEHLQVMKIIWHHWIGNFGVRPRFSGYLNLVIWMQANITLKWSEVTQSCPTLCDPVDCSPPGSSIHGIRGNLLHYYVCPQLFIIKFLSFPGVSNSELCNIL